jgi:subtilase family serine protease
MYQPPGSTENEMSLTMQLLKLRGEISDLDISEGRLSIQESQLQVLIAQYEGYMQGALASGSASLISQARERLAAYQKQLAEIQTQLGQIRAQKEALIQQRELVLSRLQVVRATAPGSGFSPAYGGTAAPPWQPTRPRRRWGKMIFWLSLLVVLVVVLLIGRSIYPSVISSIGNTPANEVDPSFYTASGTAPSDSECLSQFNQPCYSPEDIQQAFRFNPLYEEGYTGKGQTIVIIGAGYTTTLQADLHTFDQAWGLPDPKLTILHPDGPTVPYQCGTHDGLQGENTLDVEWAHAIAPDANITLIIGSNDSGGPPQNNCAPVTMVDDVNYAVDHQLGQVISISYGGSELGSSSDSPQDKNAEKQYFLDSDSVFRRATQAGITIVVAAGDDGATNPNGSSRNAVWQQPNVSWPTSDPYVLAVGGTTLTVDPGTSTYGREVVWNQPGQAATGGGLSVIYPEPDYQKLVPNQNLFQNRRGVPDVAFPAEDFMLYGSFFPGQVPNDPQWKHWGIIGGTSVSAPAWAGLIAIADQMRGSPLGQIQPALYSLGGKDMHDITQGNNTFENVQGYQAQEGYDLATGWGTPIANTFVPALVQAVDQAGNQAGGFMSGRHIP